MFTGKKRTSGQVRIGRAKRSPLPPESPPQFTEFDRASLQQALELTPGGRSASLAEGLTFKPTLTFSSIQQTWCRQYELSYGTALRSGGLACRRRDGVWRVIALTEPEPPLAAPGPDKIVPASKDDILDEARAQIKSGDVLAREEEERLIKEHWPTKP